MISEFSVSVIIPMYNSQNTINKCVSSILEQTYSNIEIIIVNDGSTDDSFNICINNWGHIDRLHLISIDNGGVSNARNVGISAAHGEYCCFVDSDDWIEPEHIERLVDSMQGADCVVCGYTLDRDTESYPCSLSDRKYIVTQATDTDDIAPFFINGFIHPCWNKLYKTALIKENNITFNRKISISEDSVFCLQYMKHCVQINIIDSVTYHYWVPSINDKSLSKKLYPNSFSIYEIVQDQLMELLNMGLYSDEYKLSVLSDTMYPQIYSTIMKVYRSKSIAFKEKKAFLNHELKRPFIVGILQYKKNKSNTPVEAILLWLIRNRWYRAIALILTVLS